MLQEKSDRIYSSSWDYILLKKKTKVLLMSILNTGTIT